MTTAGRYDHTVRELLVKYKQETEDELEQILSWWIKYMPDEEKGGFYGSVSNENVADPTADKGLVLNSRILWAFSTACLHNGNKDYLLLAKRAFAYIEDHFTDKTFGGVYWSVTAHGEACDTRKQIYGLAFYIYGLSAYYKASRDNRALERAMELFSCIEQYSFDQEHNGYTEAFTRDWKRAGDLRLSAKDDNESKTMNTHLHIVEAYAELYEVHKEEKLKERIINLLQLCDRYFINTQTGHLNLFFDDHWTLKSSLQSYGHDIEAAWLLQHCAAVIADEELIRVFSAHALSLTHAAAEALDKDGGLWYEYEPAGHRWIKEKHSWPQAEAMIGFMNAWQVSGEQKYLLQSWNSWSFIEQHIKDPVNGEWFWGVQEDYTPMLKEKAGFWKCPYHSARACIRVSKLISDIL